MKRYPIRPRSVPIPDRAGDEVPGAGEMLAALAFGAAFWLALGACIAYGLGCQ